MKLEELYQKIGGDLKDVKKRIPNEAMIGKFVRKYANDPTYNRLTAAVEAKNWKDAFIAAHTLKGVAQNLGFDRLQKSASALTEAVRGAVPLTDESLFEEVCKDQKEISSFFALRLFWRFGCRALHAVKRKIVPQSRMATACRTCSCATYLSRMTKYVS